MHARKLVIVYRKTRLDELLERHSTRGQVEFYLSRLGDDIQQYDDEHLRYYEAIKTIKLWAKERFKLQLVERSHVSSFNFAHDDIIVVIGQDGLVANCLKYLPVQKVISINPLPDIYDGKLLPFNMINFQEIITAEANNDTHKIKDITMAQVTTSLGQSLLAVNDLFIGPRSHSSLRYQLKFANKIEEQSSSGIIISTGLGATGWLASIIAGAEGLSGNKVGERLRAALSWEAKLLCFSVREPFPSKATSTDCVFGHVNEQQPLTVISKTPENAVIFSDGIESDFINFNAGTTATVSVAKQQGRLIVG